MAGSWETPPSVLLAFLHTDIVPTAWALGLRNLQVPGPVMPLAGMPYDHARNAACMKALDLGVDFLFFLDSDVVPPNDAILRLVRHNKPLISGVYCRRSPPAAVPVMIKNGTWVTQFPANAVIEVDLVGAGCLLISTDLLRKVPPIDAARGKHWFDWRVDMQGVLPPGEALSEDFAFNLHVRRTLGIPTLVDTSIQCRHVGLAQATYGKFEPCDANPVT